MAGQAVKTKVAGLAVTTKVAALAVTTSGSASCHNESRGASCHNESGGASCRNNSGSCCESSDGCCEYKVVLLAAAVVFKVAFVMDVEEFCNAMLAVAMLGLGYCAISADIEPWLF